LTHYPHPRLSTAYGKIDADVNFGPQPVQRPHPPIWIGGNTLPALRRVARWGDGWQPVFLSPETIQQKTETLHALMQEAGRDAAQLEITTLVGSNVSVAQAQAYQAAGVQELYMLTTTDRPDELFAQMKQFVAIVRAVGNG
jgi:alkanesulfonate monooxygenase SsuD/methylene tetrahydromethanopterin reductase-like flavin-dependent oxidoreductase (luciferase family)